MKVFVIGPMTGYENFNFPKFKECEDALSMSGMRVQSMRQIVNTIFGGDAERPSEEYMKVALDKLNTWADAVCMLPGWEQSSNASTEVAVALALKLQFVNSVGLLIRPPQSITVINKSPAYV